MVRTVIELMYRKGDKKFRYDTKKQKQVQMVIQDLKELKLGSNRESVFDQIIAGERIVSGTVKRTAASTMEQPQAEQLQITPGIVPPEEQFQQFLENERYERRQIFPAIAGGSTGLGDSYNYLGDKHRAELLKAWLDWTESWRNYWLSTAKLWSVHIAPGVFKDDQDSYRPRWAEKQ